MWHECQFEYYFDLLKRYLPIKLKFFLKIKITNRFQNIRYSLKKNFDSLQVNITIIL